MSEVNDSEQKKDEEILQNVEEGKVEQSDNADKTENNSQSENNETKISQTKETPAPQKSSQTPKKRWFKTTDIIWIIGICLIIFLFYHLFFNTQKEDEETLMYTTQVPYVFEKSFQNKLSEYLHEPNHSRLLIVYGPKGVGKTAGLNKITRVLTKTEGRLAVDFDLSKLSKFSTIQDVMQYLQVSFSRSIKVLSGSTFKSSVLKTILPTLEIFSSICTPGDVFNATFLSDPDVINVSNVVNSIISSLERTPELASRTFFEALDSVSEQVKPVVFIHSPELLLQSRHKNVRNAISALISECEKTVLSGNISVVFEVSDQTAFLDGRIGAARSQYELFYVNEFEQELSRQTFLKEKTFKKEHLQDLWEICRGLGECYATALTLLGEGYSIKNTVKEIQTNANRRLYSAIASSANQGKSKEYLDELLSSGTLPLSKKQNIASHFIDWKVVSVFNQSKVIIQNAALAKAVRSLDVTQKK